MKIELKKITVKELTENYEDKGDAGVVGYGGKLDIRPPYQREFIYKGAQRDAVIDTIRKGFPLNVMYWAVRPDGTFEVMDGQQRTISICQYVNGDYSFNDRAFYNLESDEQQQILDYKLMIYQCEGEDSEKLDWFKTINIAGEKLTAQELRNAVYHGTWLADAKNWFSKPNCPAQAIGDMYLNGSPIRQEYLEKVIDWHSEGKIEKYMSEHQHQDSAKELWNYFEGVIDWVRTTFPVERKKEMKGLEWGDIHRKHGRRELDSDELEEKVEELMANEEIQRKRGIYEYVLDGDESHLKLRQFSDSQKRSKYEQQGGKCAICGEAFDYEEMEGDHIKPWSKEGKTEFSNLQMVSIECNRKKGAS
ncbi:MAG: DUF262 domain-containing protein [Gammaproteobacteria bacterium AqS3]|nr:DUF262 domain-containing protein [Gammaproteobacteria bacterium AqS3]